MCEIWPRFQRQSTLSRPHLKMQQDVRTLKQTSCVGMITIVLATFGEVGSTPPPLITVYSAVDYSISLKFCTEFKHMTIQVP